MTGEEETSVSIPAKEETVPGTVATADQGPKPNEDRRGDPQELAVAKKETSLPPEAKKKDEKPVRPKYFPKLTPDEEKLIKLSEEGNVDEIRGVLRNKKIRVDCLDDSGTTPLEHACYKGNRELVELLLAAGADINNNMQVQGYTPLMFAALAGKLEIVRILLQHGARTSATNSIGRNASQLAGFVGNHAIAITISNFFTVEDLDYYTVIHGLETEPRLPAAVAPSMHRFIMQTNLHPVKLIYFLRKNPILIEEQAKVMRTMESIVEKEIKSREMNEIMAMKVHYYSCVLKYVTKMLGDGKTFEDMIKLFVRGVDAKGFPEYTETFLRQSIRSFPYYQTPLHTTMVHAIAKANLGGSGGSLSILEQSINGQHMAGRDGPPCETCADPDAKKKCSACRMVAYCNEECQKVHWPIHKKECKELAEQFILMEQRKKDEEERDRIRKEDEERDKIRKQEEAAAAKENESHQLAIKDVCDLENQPLLDSVDFVANSDPELTVEAAKPEQRDDSTVVRLEDVGVDVRIEKEKDDSEPVNGGKP